MLQYSAASPESDEMIPHDRRRPASFLSFPQRSDDGGWRRWWSLDMIQYIILIHH